MRRGQDSYEVEFSGSVAYGNDELTTQGTFDVAGADYAGTLRVSQQRVRVTSEIIVKDGVEYVRPPGEEWQRLLEPPEPLPGDLFSYIGPNDWLALEYVGPQTRDGRELHHLRIPTLDWEGLSELLLDSGPVGTSVRTLEFDLWVTDDGRPRAAEVSFDGTYRESGIEVDMTYHLEYTFQRFGEQLEIEAPEDFIDPDSPSS